MSPILSNKGYEKSKEVLADLRDPPVIDFEYVARVLLELFSNEIVVFMQFDPEF